MGDDPRPLMSDAWGCDSVSIFREVTASTKMLLQTQQSRRPTKTSGFALSPIRAVFLDSNRWVVELMGLQCRCFYPQSDRASIASAQWPASRFFVAMCLVRLKIFDGRCLNHWPTSATTHTITIVIATAKTYSLAVIEPLALKSGEHYKTRPRLRPRVFR
jgi:hypothetical protein